VNGRSGTAKALAYSPSHSTLYVLHAFGPDHVRLMSVDEEGNLTARPEGYTVNTMDKPKRVATMASLTADEKLLVVGTTFDQPAAANPDGSPILWAEKNGVRIDGNVLSVVKDPACPKVPGNGTFRALNGTVSSGPAEPDSDPGLRGAAPTVLAGPGLPTLHEGHCRSMAKIAGLMRSVEADARCKKVIRWPCAIRLGFGRRRRRLPPRWRAGQLPGRAARSYRR
jgi:hypothetical protein